MILLSESAKLKILNQLKNRGKGLGIKLGVKTTGCSGLAYTLEFCDKIEEHDLVTDYIDFKVIVDSKSNIYLDGTTVDYVKRGLNEGFEFINPKERDRCGCGESFRV